MHTFFQLFLNGIGAWALYALVAVGFNLIYGTTKFFNLTHGAMLAVGAYAVFWLTDSVGLSIYAAAVVGVLSAGVAGCAVDKIVYEPLRRRKASNMVLLVASLGALTVIQALIAIAFTSQFRSLRPDASPHVVEIFGGTITRTQVIIFACAIVTTVSLSLLLNRTTFGKAVKAVSDDEEVAAIVGIDPTRLMGYVFFIGSAIAGLAGILVGLDAGIDPVMGLNLLLKGVIAAIIGGLGSISGAVLGALILGLIENFAIWQIPGVWKDAIAFGVLIVFLLFRPRGLLGRS